MGCRPHVRPSQARRPSRNSVLVPAEKVLQGFKTGLYKLCCVKALQELEVYSLGLGAGA